MSAEAIANLRKRFEEEVAAHPDLYHTIDIDRVRNEEYQVKRYILDQPDQNEDKAFEALCKAMQWKKSFGIHDRTDQYFPKEVWELNNVEIYGRDNEGRVVQWEGMRNQRTFKETQLLARQFVAHCMEKLDRTAGENGFILVTDCNGAGISNVDMDVARFKISSIEHYPLGLKAFYVVDLPWLLNSVMKIIVGLMSPKLKQLVHYVKRTELPKLMDTKNIPQCLDGERDKHAYPQDLIRMDIQYKELNYDTKFVDQFYKTFKLERINP